MESRTEEIIFALFVAVVLVAILYTFGLFEMGR